MTLVTLGIFRFLILRIPRRWAFGQLFSMSKTNGLDLTTSRSDIYAIVQFELSITLLNMLCHFLSVCCDVLSFQFIYSWADVAWSIHCSQSVTWCEKGWKTIVHFWVCARSVWTRHHKTLFSSLHSWNVCQSLSQVNNSVYPHNNNVQQNPNCTQALQCKHGALHSCKTSASNFVYFQSALSA